MGVNVETGVALHTAGSGHKLTISAPSVTSTSVILLTLERPEENPLEECAVVYSREPGTGFVVGVTAGGAESHIDWAVIN
jgi:hypothetical protein